jgi:hypothetical protein
MRSPASAERRNRMSSTGPEALDLGLYRHPDGGPVRLRGNGRRSRATGLYFSIKSGRHLPYESRLELHDLWRAEVCSKVVSAWPQPFTLQLMMDGELRRYTPDRQDILADGQLEVIEIKDDLRLVRDPTYLHKLELVAARAGVQRR